MKLFKLLLLSLCTLFISISAYSQTASFTVDKTQGCGSLTSNFVNTSTNYDSIRWYLGVNGITIKDSTNVGATYTPGTYTARLVAYKGANSDTAKVTLHVYKPPVANFSVNKVKACLPDTAKFTDLSQKGDGTITSWVWDFRDGTISNAENPVKIYTATGGYTVVLQVTDANNCTANISKDDYIDVENKPVVDFSASPSGGCTVPLAVQFTNTSTGPGTLTYAWAFGNGNVSSQQNPSTNYTLFGNYTVKLIVTSTDYGCSSSLSVPAISIGQVKAQGTLTQNSTTITNNDTICAGDIDFQSTSTGAASVIWDFGDNNPSSSTSGTHQYVNAGTYTVMLIASSGGGCTDTARWNITVEKATAEFLLNPDQSCSSSPVQVTFTNQSVNAVSYLWTFYDGSTSTAQNPVFTFTPSGDANPYVIHAASTYNTTLTVESKHNCSGTAQHTFTIQRPTALFSIDTAQGCAPLTVKFTDHSVSNQSISFYNWQYGDGTESSLSNIYDTITHVYASAGVFNSRLIIENAQNCIDTSYNIVVKVGNKPVPSFSITPIVCDSVKLTNLNTAADSLDYWQYSVNGQSLPVIPMVPSPSVRLRTDTGTLTVTLLAGSKGCYATANQTITNAGPVDSISYTVNCAQPLSYQFKAVALGATSYLWDFGDTTTNTTSLTLTHVYTSPGNRTVTFIGYNGSCTDTVRIIVKVRQSAPSFSCVTYACSGSTLKFKASDASRDNECRDIYLWNFNDSTPPVYTEADSVFHSFSVGKKYKVILTSVFDNGCSDTVSKTINILQPNAKFKASATSGCTPLQVTFTDQSTPDVNPIKEWDWDFGNGETYSAAFSGNIYTTYYDYASQYNVLLTVTDTMGCTDTTSVNVTAATPTSDFYPTASTYCSNATAEFFYSYSNPDSLLWNFGDGQTSKVMTNPMPHVFSASNGDHIDTVSLTVYKNGCTSPIYSLPITIQFVSAAFAVSDSVYDCYPEQITFTHLYPTNVVSGNWSFGDQSGTDPYLISPTHFYQRPGNYTAKLIVQTSAGCVDSASRAIQINGPTGNFKMSDSTVCKGDSITLTMYNASNLTSYEWDLGDGRIITTGNPLKFKYASVGTKHVSLILHGADSCNPSAITDSIVVENVTAKFLASDTVMCDQTNVIFTNKSSGNDQQLWDFGDGNTTAVTSPQHVYSTGNYIVSLYVSNTTGCKDTANKALVVNAFPELSVTYDKKYCSQNKALLVATTDAGSVVWSPSVGLNATNTDTVIAYFDTLRTTFYKAIVTNSANCSVSDSIKVYRPYLDISPKDTSVVIGQTVPVDLKDSSGIASFTWVPAAGLSCTNCLNPVITPIAALTSYQLILKEPSGCFSDTVHIQVKTDDSNLTLDAPSAFRPGHGDKNSYFLPSGRGIKQILEFKIYNRWGNLVFSGSDLSVGWDGTYQGKDQPIDSYIYIITAETFDGQIHTKKGSVLLLR